MRNGRTGGSHGQMWKRGPGASSVNGCCPTWFSWSARKRPFGPSNSLLDTRATRDLRRDAWLRLGRMGPQIISNLQRHSIQFRQVTGRRKAIILRIALHPTQISNLKLKLSHPLQSRLEFLIVANHLEPKRSSKSRKMSMSLGAGFALTNEPKTMNRARCPLTLARA